MTNLVLSNRVLAGTRSIAGNRTVINIPRTLVGSMWSGLAINYNYNGTGSNPAIDLQNLYDLGFRRVRLLVVTYNDNSQITAWRSIVQTALAIGFTEVTYGVSAGGNTITSSNYLSIFAVMERYHSFMAIQVLTIK